MTILGLCVLERKTPEIKCYEHYITSKVAVPWVPRPWGFSSGAHQGQLQPVFCLGPPGLSCESRLRRPLLVVLGLGIPRQSHAVNLGGCCQCGAWGHLAIGIGAEGWGVWRAHWVWLLLVWEDLGSCEAWAKTSHSMGKLREWARKLGGTKSLGVSRARRTVLASLMET